MAPITQKVRRSHYRTAWRSPYPSSSIEAIRHKREQETAERSHRKTDNFGQDCTCLNYQQTQHNQELMQTTTHELVLGILVKRCVLNPANFCAYVAKQKSGGQLVRAVKIAARTSKRPPNLAETKALAVSLSARV